MPIAPELRHLYRTKEYFAARDQCLKRAKGKCEWCGRPSRQTVKAALDGTGRWFDEPSGKWRCGLDRYEIAELRRMIEERLTASVPPGGRARLPRELTAYGYSAVERPLVARLIFVVLTTAHLDHNPENNAPENLAGLCQRCHLVYDGPHHRTTARLRRDRETGQLRLELVG